jgi:DNA-damage-inducible protein D
MTASIFESIRHINEFGKEFWSARELAKVLGYRDFGNFENVVEKAKESCKNS